jgi:metal-sulfur cluster biosynthetic enzyme
MFIELRKAGSAVVPVVTLDETPETYLAVREVIVADQCGMVLRLDCEEALEETPADLTIDVAFKFSRWDHCSMSNDTRER